VLLFPDGVVVFSVVLPDAELVVFENGFAFPDS